MRVLTLAIAVVAALVGPALAQQGKMGGNAPPSDQRPGEEPKPIVDEKKYKSAVDVMGDSTQRYDPWGTIREKSPAKPKSK